MYPAVPMVVVHQHGRTHKPRFLQGVYIQTNSASPAPTIDASPGSPPPTPNSYATSIAPQEKE